MLRPDFDAIRLVVDVENSFLDLFVNLASCVDEGLLHVGCRFGRCLHKDEAVFTSERFALFLLYFTSGLEITEQRGNML